MRTGRTPHPDPTLSAQPEQQQEKFRWETDAQGRTSLVHQGMNHQQRRAQKSIQKKAFKHAIKKLQARARRAEHAMAKQGTTPAAQDFTTEPEVEPSPEEG